MKRTGAEIIEELTLRMKSRQRAESFHNEQILQT